MTIGPTFLRALLVLVFVIALAAALLYPDSRRPAGVGVARGVRALVASEPAHRDLAAYEGLGAWVDGFDFAAAYQGAGDPAVSVASVADMADANVATLYIQGARNDPRSPEGIVDRERLASFLVVAHQHGIRVVAWYLPRFEDLELDSRNLALLDQFEVLGHRFDGIAVDIEYTDAVPDHLARNQALIALSQRLRVETDGDVLGAIVLPPVQTEVVNPRLWPEFPWSDIAGLYDVWLPMSYWSFRSDESEYGDGYRYNEESTRRLRANLADPTVPVHGIGGIGDAVSTAEVEQFVASLVDTGSVGGSIYDWATLSPEHRQLLASNFESGAASELAAE